MDNSSHQQYLASEWWQTRRREYLAAHVRCERCSIPRWLASIAYGQDLHVHHKNYQTKGAERDEDLQAVCRRCHDLEHQGRSEYRPPKMATCEVCASPHFNIYSDTCEKCDGVLSHSVPETIHWDAIDVLNSGSPLWEMAIEAIEWTLGVNSDDPDFDALKVMEDHLRELRKYREEYKKNQGLTSKE